MLKRVAIVMILAAAAIGCETTETARETYKAQRRKPDAVRCREFQLKKLHGELTPEDIKKDRAMEKYMQTR